MLGQTRLAPALHQRKIPLVAAGAQPLCAIMCRAQGESPPSVRKGGKRPLQIRSDAIGRKEPVHELAHPQIAERHPLRWLTARFRLTDAQTSDIYALTFHPRHPAKNCRLLASRRRIPSFRFAQFDTTSDSRFVACLCRSSSCVFVHQGKGSTSCGSEAAPSLPI